MLGRLTYALRETAAGFQRNLTLTMAAIITSAVSLMLVGATFMIQRGFDNLLSRWAGDVEMIVFVRADASDEQKLVIEEALRSQPAIDAERLRYLDQAESYEEAQRIFAGDPSLLRTLTPEITPSQWKVVPSTDNTEVLQALGESFQEIEGVQAVAYAQARQVFGQSLGHFAISRARIARMAATIFASRQFSYHVARELDEGRGEMEASLVKLVACRDAEWVTRDAMQLHGGMGYSEEYAVSRLWQDARVLSIFEGGEEVLAVYVVARSRLASGAVR